MELNQLKTFYLLAQTKNYSKCAQKLFVTQSAVSHSIKKLESSLSLKLIEKKGKGFSLTAEGKSLFKGCQTVFFELDRIKERLLSAQDYPEVIRLGSPVEFGTSVLIKNMKAFYDQHPKIHVDFRLSHELLLPLLDDELDMIIDCQPHLNSELKTIKLFREEYAVIASADYLAEHPVNEISDLSRCNILSVDKELLWWSNFINVLPIDEGITFNKVTEINHIRGIINAALCSIGVGFVPKYTVLKELENATLIELFPELDILKDQINIYIKKNNACLKKNLAFIKFINRIKLQ